MSTIQSLDPQLTYPKSFKKFLHNPYEGEPIYINSTNSFLNLILLCKQNM